MHSLGISRLLIDTGYPYKIFKMCDTVDLIKKVFALECQMNEQESSHQRDMDWLKDMYTFEAEHREALKLHLSVVNDLLVAEKQRSANLEAKIELLEAEKRSAVNAQRKYKKAYEEVVEIADALVEDAEKNNIRKEEEEQNIFQLLEATLEGAQSPVQPSASTSAVINIVDDRPSRRRISWIHKRIWRKLNIPSISMFFKTLLF